MWTARGHYLSLACSIYFAGEGTQNDDIEILWPITHTHTRAQKGYNHFAREIEEESKPHDVVGTIDARAVDKSPINNTKNNSNLAKYEN